ncbi:MAG TPA: glycoside hydrolase family 15 protein [Chloroflexia bacterium]|nr:glycoside hydrolase family 15 protein [Chloroflexia bacterium]
MAEGIPFLTYPPVAQHGLIGDRRTAALVAGDGSIDWLCLPVFDGVSFFGSLLDANKGGLWRLGPAEPFVGRQRYSDGTAVLVTTWSRPGFELELTDAMLWPETDRTGGNQQGRAIVRHIRCLSGRSSVVSQFAPRFNFEHTGGVQPENGGAVYQAGGHKLSLWTSFPMTALDGQSSDFFYLNQDEEAWAVLSVDQPSSQEWSIEKARAALQATRDYWQNRQNRLIYHGSHEEQVLRSAQVLQLLTYAPQGSLVAAPTTSLPLRVGGSYNWDYRYSWVRDAALAVSIMSTLGDHETVEGLMNWLVKLARNSDSPLHTVYTINGDSDFPAQPVTSLEGYQGSQPVRVGNRAYNQLQPGAVGYLAEALLNYLEHDGKWSDEYWYIVQKRIAQDTIARWREPDNGIWELPQKAHYVSSKVMCWVALDRAIKIAEKTGHKNEIAEWRSNLEALQDEIMERGWSDKMGAFRQRYDQDSMDASALLIPIVGFLPSEHPFVLSTLEKLVERLVNDGMVHRFEANDGSGEPENSAAGDFQGAYLPCTFWLANAFAKAGLAEEAEEILQKVETKIGEMGLFAEILDTESDCFMGNYPLAFSHAEYLSAVLALAEARPLDNARLKLGQLTHHLQHLFKHK